jgi:predicted O-linked N-acetylglucosamine transferase (SPINDLY family)
MGMCDLHISTFPFGGTNGTIDSLMIGIPVVALRGTEPHSRFDAMILEYAGLEDLAVADSEEAFEDLVVNLVNSPAALALLAYRVSECDVEKEFFGEREGIAAGAFGRAMWRIFHDHERLQADPSPMLRWQDYDRGDL